MRVVSGKGDAGGERFLPCVESGQLCPRTRLRYIVVFSVGLPVSQLMRGDIDDLLSAACQGIGHSLQACCATQVDQSAIT